jgi:hypothetical protein
MSKVKIIAGPCSINHNNVKDLYDISLLNTKTQNCIFGLRVVGLKSRTELKHSTEYMGIDFDAHLKLCKDLINGIYSMTKDTTYPSIEIAKEIHSHHSEIRIASEIVDPFLQIPVFAMNLGDKFIPWNPSVDQLGWFMGTIGEYAKKYNLTIGIKNAKNFGTSIIESEIHNKPAPIEKVWKGMATYTGIHNDPNRIIMIQRGVDDPLNGNYRNFPIHKCAARVKKDTNYQMFFDPSHTLGPKLRDEIVDQTIQAMKMKMEDGRFLYDGILVEVGNSTTDTEQHITIGELSNMIDRISEFRQFYES